MAYSKKGSPFCGAIESGPITNRGNSPTGSTKDAKGRKAGSNVAQTSYTVTNRNPKSVKDNPIGMNNPPQGKDKTGIF